MGEQSKGFQRGIPGPVKKLVCVHLLNDFSGSPLVFSTCIKGLRKLGYSCDLHTCGGRKGFLSDLDINYYYFPYQFIQNPIFRAAALLFSQVVLFFKLLRYKDEKVVFYVNTLLPFGAALAGKFLGKPVVYHIHESSV